MLHSAICNICCRHVAEVSKHRRLKMDSIEAIIEEFEIEKLMRGNGVARFHKNVDKAESLKKLG